MKERIVGPAMRDKENTWHLPSPAGHADTWEYYGKPRYEESGFLTNTSRFVSRVEAMKIAKACGQVPAHLTDKRLESPMLRLAK